MFHCLHFALLPALCALCLSATASLAALEPADSTWHIGFQELWGVDEDRNRSRNLDLYVTFKDGRAVRGVASARSYNTSAHPARNLELTLDGARFSGSTEILLTPDAWVPADGQPLIIPITLEGQLVQGDSGQHRVTGTYQAQLGEDTVKGSLGGGVGETEPDWGDSAWHTDLNAAVAGDVGLQPNLKLAVGIADGKVHWARIGRSYRGPAPRLHEWDGAGFEVSDDGIVTGTSSIPARAADLLADPEATAEITVDIVRVQGLIGGSAKVSFTHDGEEVAPTQAFYGRGSGQRGHGTRSAEDHPAIWRRGIDNDPWWLPVEGFEPPASGEHPRLFFRRSDLPALRARAETQAGQAIIARLRQLLDGADGRSLPPNRRSGEPPYGDKSEPIDQPIGTFSIGHVAGYGLLYQLTGDRHYADLAKQCVEWALEGYRDRDGKARYSFRQPTGGLRAGPSVGWFAVGYDLCYDGWDEDFRQRVALEIQNYKEGGKKPYTLDRLAAGTKIPGSNHYTMMVGGAALAALAIAGDPGVDDDYVQRVLDLAARANIQAISQGWGDHGYFAEGCGTGSMSSQITFLPSLMAWRTAAGKDYISARSDVRWMTLKWILGTIVSSDGDTDFPHYGGYPHNVWARKGLSGSGYFAFGLGALPPAQRQAAHGFYDRFLAKPDKAAGQPYDTASLYPHLAVLSFINWPIDEEAVDPATVLPQAVADTVHGYFLSRNRWQDANDTVTSLYLGTGPKGYISGKDTGHLRIWGLGVRAKVKNILRNGTPTFYERSPDGSYILSAREDGISGLAIDFSGASGATALVAKAGQPSKRKPKLSSRGAADGADVAHHQLTIGDHLYHIFILHRGEAPEPQVDGTSVRVGDQTISFDGARIHLGTFTPEP